MAKNCNSGRAKEPPDTRVVLYRFPKSPRISNRWIKGLRLSKWTPKPSSVLCSLHFEEDCFMPGTFNDPLQRPKLNPKAVPTIFDHGKKKTAENFLKTAVEHQKKHAFLTCFPFHLKINRMWKRLRLKMTVPLLQVTHVYLLSHNLL